MINQINSAESNSNELIRISEQNGKQAVSARELYEFLGFNKAHWNRWYNKNIVENQFALEYDDYEGFTLMVNGNETQDFALSIDFSKKISMMARTEKGEQARKYFIECEKKLKSIAPAVDFSNPDTVLMLAQNWKEEQTRRIEAERINEENKPKVLFTDAVVGSTSSCLIGELAKVISQNGFTIGQNRLFDWLRENGYLGKIGERRNIPNQQYVEQGLFELKKGVRSGSDGVLHTTITTKVTGKGQVYFVGKFLNQKISA